MTRRDYIRVTGRAILVPGWATGSPVCGKTATPKADLVVIVHPTNRFETLDHEKLNHLYLRKVSRWPWGAETFPIDLPSQSALRHAFTQSALRTSEERLAEYWIDQEATHGIRRPAEAQDEIAARAMVAARPGAIAYIWRSNLNATVKPIRVQP